MVSACCSPGGQPLDAATREFFSSRFGHDFANVRVHADAGPPSRRARSMRWRIRSVGTLSSALASMRRERARDSSFWPMN